MYNSQFIMFFLFLFHFYYIVIKEPIRAVIRKKIILNAYKVKTAFA